jgi:hypothetical protein
MGFSRVVAVLPAKRERAKMARTTSFFMMMTYPFLLTYDG